MFLLAFFFAPWAGFLNDGDLCSLAFLIWLLIFIGSRVIQSAPSLQAWGLKIAATAALIQVGTDVTESGPHTPTEALRIVLHALAAGGLVLGPAWMALAIVSYFRDLYRRMTSAATARAMARKQQREKQKREAEESERKRQRDSEWEKTRPEREQATREAAERARIEADRKCQQLRDEASSQKRREEARLLCVLTFDKCGSTLAKTFPRKRLDQYFETYMTDAHSADAVETRAQELVRVLETCASAQGGRSRTRFQSLSEVATFYEEQRRMIRELAYEQDVIDSFLVMVNRQEDAAIKNFLSTAAQ